MSTKAATEVKSVLVTGGAGYIGSITSRLLLDRGYSVSILDNLSTGHRSSIDKRAKFFEGDIADDRLLEQIFIQERPSAVFHFAGAAIVSESFEKKDFYWDNNVERAKILAQTCARLNVRNFIFSSTASVYGDPTQNPVLETAPLKPVNPYGETKLAFEKYLQELHFKNQLNPIVFRYFNVSGAWPDGSLGEWHEPETHVIPKMLLDATKSPNSMQVSIFGTDYATPDGSCIRDYTHVLDLAEAHILGLENIHRFKGDVFNLGSQKGYSVFEVAKVIQSTMQVKLTLIKEPRRPGDPAVLVADSSKARKLLGWKPSRESLQEMIESSWKWIQNLAQNGQSR